ncbi:MAG: hypothetical protein HY519_03385 [Candidatus Aenigmarchaeota archaeon]|nr:hypothetical protein [Candidatus Aenigmarchaeota archaeon]
MKLVKAGLLAGLVIFVIWFALGTLFEAIFSFSPATLPGMRALDSPLMLLFFAMPWVYGFTMAFAYPYVEKSLTGNYVKKGYSFGLLVWLLAIVPAAAIVFASMDYPLGFNISQVVSSLVFLPAGGIAIARLYR